MASRSQERNAKSMALTIMLTKGAFVTPRSVIKNMTTRQRPQAEKIIEEMKSLEKKGIGNVKNVARAQTVFYKPLPSDDNKDCVSEIVGEQNWDIYVQRFKEVDTMYITASQHNRLLVSADNEEELESFGIVTR